MINQIGAYNTAQQGGVNKPSGILDKDDFLKLLIMQLRHQDPLSPLEGTEFAAQLAHFSSVEQLSNINSNLLHSIDANFVLSQSINNALSATFIGREVRAATDMFTYTGDGEVTLGYNLGSPAESVIVKIYDETGNLVHTIHSRELNQGDNTITWDGRDEKGTRLKEGNYRFSVESKDGNGAGIDASLFVYGIVSGVRFKHTGTYFTINGIEVSLSDIEEIREG
jgi:flagellar basal-body rod modification protein FlgD